MKSEILLKVVFGFVASFSLLYSQTIPNYVKTTTYFEKIFSSTPGSIVSTSYSDGLGRTIQDQVLINGTNNSLVTGTEYDDAGRPQITIVPFVHSGSDYISGSLRVELLKAGIDKFSFSATEYSQDPLSRVIGLGGPGFEFSLYSTHYIKRWYFGQADKSCIPCSELQADALDKRPNNENAKYFLTVIKDQNGNYSQVLSDINGKPVLSWSHPDQKGKVGTASCNESLAIVAKYDYDIMGNLIAETPPGTSGQSKYRYNTLGQLISKTTPDQGSIDYSYSPTGELISVVDQKMKDTLALASSTLSTYSLANSYDFADRILSTYTDKTTTQNAHIYQIKIRNFYDNPSSAVDYICPSNSADPELQKLRTILLDPQVNPSNANYPQNTRGRLGVTIAYGERCSPVSDINDYCTQCADRVIEVYSYNDEGQIACKWKYIPSLPLQEKQYTYDNIQGNLVKEVSIFNSLSTGSQQVIHQYSYDENNRLESILTNGMPAVYFYYDEKGRVSKKMFYSPNGTKVDEVGYSYDNKHDWLNEINSNTFSEKITYLDYSAAEEDKIYNGNISSTIVTQKTNRNSTLDLIYKYDGLNRLTNVVHNSPITGDNRFDASYSYDKNGRLLSKQEGESALTGYNYESLPDGTQSNRLANIASKSSKANVFDPDGNLVFDRSKNMGIVYDWRNMPVEFRFYKSIPDDVKWYEAGNLENTRGVKLLSVVSMLYDASGDRVLKRESKPKPSL